MFENLTGRLGEVLGKLTKRGALNEADVTEAMREVRVALLEADVALPVVKSFIKKVKAKAIGTDVLGSINPGQMVIKVVHDELVEILGSESQELNLVAVPPIVYMMVGLQGSGKTTSTAKIAKLLTKKHGKKVMMASLDVRRPAAQEQLRVLGEQIEIATLLVVEGQQPVEIAKRALQSAELKGYDVILLDTAGRLHVDEQLMMEMKAVHEIAAPTETLLVVDSLTGQDAVNVAEQFKERVDITGIVMTRIDGDGRGGAALSMRAITGCPIKLLGTGEKLDELEAFHPDRIANRILGMGDIVSLVEKASELIEKDEAEKLALKIQKGIFDLDDLASQLRQMLKMGGMSSLIGMLPGVGKMKKQLEGANLDDKMLKRQIAIVESMTPKERRNPQIIAASRKRRIATGAGMTVQDVNRLMKQHKQMASMMKKVKKLGKKGVMRGGMQGLLPPGMKL